MLRNKGFTLIELLVVIAIIAVLMGILMPALAKVKEQARDQVCRAHLKNVGLGITMYLQDNDYKFSDMHTHSNNTNGHLWWDAAGNQLAPGADRAYWGIAYMDYVKDRELFGCSAWRNFAKTVAKDLLYGGDYELIYCSAYGANGWLSTENTSIIRNHAEVVVAHDHMEPRIENGNNAGNSDMLFPSPNGTNLTHYRSGGSRAAWYRGIFRHNIRSDEEFRTGGTLNVLWLDGHADGHKETTGEGFLKRYYDPLDKN